MIQPTQTSIQGLPAPWDDTIEALWRERVAPLFAAGEECSRANFFHARPYRNEYDSGSDATGFVYTVEPGRRVCVLELEDGPCPA